MKKTLAILAMMMVAVTAFATNWTVCIKYLTRNDPNARYVLKNNSDGSGSFISVWHSTVPKPTKAEMIAVEIDAIAWKKNLTETKDADYDKWPMREKAMLKFLVKQINLLRVHAGAEALTKAQVIAGIKAEM